MNRHRRLTIMLKQKANTENEEDAQSLGYSRSVNYMYPTGLNAQLSQGFAEDGYNQPLYPSQHSHVEEYELGTVQSQPLSSIQEQLYQPVDGSTQEEELYQDGSTQEMLHQHGDGSTLETLHQHGDGSTQEMLHQHGDGSIQETLHQHGDGSAQETLHQHGDGSIQETLHQHGDGSIQETLHQYGDGSAQEMLHQHGDGSSQDMFRSTQDMFQSTEDMLYQHGDGSTQEQYADEPQHDLTQEMLGNQVTSDPLDAPDNKQLEHTDSYYQTLLTPPPVPPLAPTVDGNSVQDIQDPAALPMVPLPHVPDLIDSDTGAPLPINSLQLFSYTEPPTTLSALKAEKQQTP